MTNTNLKIKVNRLGIKDRHLPPDKVYLLIDNEYFNENERYILDGTIIIPLSEYTEWCVNGYPEIHRVSSSKSVLKKYKRAYDYKKICENIDD